MKLTPSEQLHSILLWHQIHGDRVGVVLLDLLDAHRLHVAHHVQLRERRLEHVQRLARAIRPVSVEQIAAQSIQPLQLNLGNNVWLLQCRPTRIEHNDEHQL